NQNSFVVSDAIIIVSDIGINSLKGLELFIALWEDIVDRLNIENNIKGLLINKYNPKSSISKEFVEYCQEEEEIRKLLFNSYIPLDEKISECELSRKPVNILFKNYDIYNKYNAFVDELISRV
ncbi:MAG: ParA family protein, partial [Clostridiales bacterium]|nr:ParA family protein [Clostridiales bacterium]